MPPFATPMPYDTLTQYVMHVRDFQYKTREIQNLVAMDHPIRRHFKKKGVIKQGVEAEFAYSLPVSLVVDGTFTDISRNSPIKSVNYQEKKGDTVAFFEWTGEKQTVTITEWDYIMCQSKNKFGSLMNRYIKRAEQGRFERRTTGLWNGQGVDGVFRFGLKHFVRAANTTDPAEGAIGGISVTQVPTWTNQVLNGGKPLILWSGVGNGIIDSFLDGEHGWEALWLNTIQASRGDSDDGGAVYGTPDLIPCNYKQWLAAKKLASLKRMPIATDAKVELGVTDALYFNTAVCFYDPDMPVTNAAHGESRFLNSMSFSEPHVGGVPNKEWSKPQQLQGQTAWVFDRNDIYTMACEQLRANAYALGYTAEATEEE